LRQGVAAICEDFGYQCYAVMQGLSVVTYCTDKNTHRDFELIEISNAIVEPLLATSLLFSEKTLQVE
jgi:hypothetical protein